ncbi:hypothetical protein BDK51DRAFT_27665, partial [Blyttiomyces helicus]
MMRPRPASGRNHATASPDTNPKRPPSAPVAPRRRPIVLHPAPATPSPATTSRAPSAATTRTRRDSVFTSRANSAKTTAPVVAAAAAQDPDAPAFSADRSHPRRVFSPANGYAIKAPAPSFDIVEPRVQKLPRNDGLIVLHPEKLPEGVPRIRVPSVQQSQKHETLSLPPHHRESISREAPPPPKIREGEASPPPENRQGPGHLRSNRLAFAKTSRNPLLRRGIVNRLTPRRERVEGEGVYPLIDRGILPPAADYSLHLNAPSDARLEARPKPIHRQEARFEYPSPDSDVDLESRPYTPALRLETPVVEKQSPWITAPNLSKATLRVIPKLVPDASTPCNSLSDIALPNASCAHTAAQTRRTPRTAAFAPRPPQEPAAIPLFAISMGWTIRGAPGFRAFVDRTRAPLPLVERAVGIVERFCRNFAVHWVELSIEKLEALFAVAYDGVLPLHALFDCVVNQDEFRASLAKPGQRYRGADGDIAAVAKIQATWKMFVKRRAHIEFITRRRACELLWRHWKTKMMRRALKRRRDERIRRNRGRVEELCRRLAAEWATEYRGHKRSYGSAKAFQSTQFSRLLDLHDPDVDVLYVSRALDAAERMHLDRMMRRSALSLDSLLTSGRLRMITPELISRFDAHASLAEMLLASRDALGVMRDAVRGRKAIIMPGIVGDADVELAAVANRELELSNSNQRALLVACGVDVLPGAILRAGDDVKAKIGEVVRAHPPISDPLHTPDLPTTAHTLHKSAYPTWSSYAKQLARVGGTIEADMADGSSRTRAPFVHVFIEPDGVVNVVGTGDRLCFPAYTPWGTMTPQHSTDTPLLITRTLSILSSIRAHGTHLSGHVRLSFVVYHGEKEPRCISIDTGFGRAIAEARSIAMAAGAVCDAGAGRACFDRRLGRWMELAFMKKALYAQKVRRFWGWDPGEGWAWAD